VYVTALIQIEGAFCQHAATPGFENAL
jgi:hypothetical protein